MEIHDLCVFSVKISRGFQKISKVLKIFQVQDSNCQQRSFFTRVVDFSVFLLFVQYAGKEASNQVMYFHLFREFLCFVEEKIVFLKAKTTISFFEKNKYTPGRQF